MDSFAESVIERAKQRRKMLQEIGTTDNVIPSSNSDSNNKRPARSMTKSNSKTKISSMVPGSPKLQHNVLNIQRGENFNMEIKLASSDDCRVEVEIQEDVDDFPSDSGASSPVGKPKEEADDEPPIRDAAKQKLNRLGQLYGGGDDANLSSPIHCSNVKLFEQENIAIAQCDLKTDSNKPRKGLKKLAALAENINQWEDDLTTTRKHEKEEPKKKWNVPTVAINSPKKTRASPSKITTPDNVVPSSPVKPSQPANPRKDNAKSLRWDKNVLDSLQSQGFTRSESSSKLTYAFNGGNVSTSRGTGRERVGKIEATVINPPPVAIEEEKLTPRPNKPPTGSIASRAAVFEAPRSPIKTGTGGHRDPALLTVSERKALFEKNKCSPLIPKAAFGMAVESSKNSPKSTTDAFKKVAEVKPACNETESKATTSNELASGIAQRIAALGNTPTISQNQIEDGIREQRRNDMALLVNRFHKNKKVGNEPAIPSATDIDRNDDNEQSIVAAPVKQKRKSIERQKGDSSKVLEILDDVKRIRVGRPSKESVDNGRIYPILSDIETATETDTPTGPSSLDASYNTNEVSSDDESSDADRSECNSSFSRNVLSSVRDNIVAETTPRTFSSSSGVEVRNVLQNMDEFLEDEYAESDDAEECNGPTPSKLGKLSDRSDSFEYKAPSSPIKIVYKQPTGIITSPTHVRSPAKKAVMSPRRSGDLPTHVVDGNAVLPLQHTVSFYRKQQSTTPVTPVRKIVRIGEYEEESDLPEEIMIDTKSVEKKLHDLKYEVEKQERVIAQSTQAVNLCNSRLEFNGSTEQVEAEKLLLIAMHRRQGALYEINRIQVEGSMYPQYQNSKSDHGTLIISNIVLPMKKEYVRALAAAGGKGHHVVCLVKCCEQVVATKLACTVASSPKNPDLELTIPGSVRLEKIFNNSTVTFEVYCLQAQEEVLPHDVKYHIKKPGSKMTPKKIKHDVRMTRPPTESPGGPSAVRTSTFALMGYVVFSTNAIDKRNWTLNKAPHMSPLEGSVEMKIKCELNITVEKHGFLTMFEDISGFGAWHRRWCLLKGHTISYWKYPDDERKKAPIDTIDLIDCISKEIALVPREICARLNTLMIEKERNAVDTDRDMLTMVRKGNVTIIRHLLSADSKEDRVSWTNEFNKALMAMRMWGSPKK